MEPQSRMNLFLCFSFYSYSIGIGMIEGKGEPGTYSKVFAIGEMKEGGDYTPAEYLKWKQDTVDYINQLRFAYEDNPPIVLDHKLCEKSQFWSTNLTRRLGKDEGPRHSPNGRENVFGGGGSKIHPEYAVNMFHSEIRYINITNPKYAEATGHYINMIAPWVGSVCPTFTHSVQDYETTYGTFLFGDEGSGSKFKKLSNADLAKKAKGELTCYFCDETAIKSTSGDTCLNAEDKYTIYCGGRAKACKTRSAYDRDGILMVTRECDYNGESEGRMGCRPYAPSTGNFNYWNKNATDCYCDKPNCNDQKFVGAVQSLDLLYKSQGAIKCSICDGAGNECLKEPTKFNHYCLPYIKSCKLREAYDRDRKLRIWRECDKVNESKGFVGCRAYAGPVPDTDSWNYWYRNGTECFCDKDGCNAEKVYTDDMSSLDSLYKSKGAMKCSLCEGSSKECLKEPSKHTEYCPPDVNTCLVREAYDRDKKLKVWRKCDIQNESKGFVGCRAYAGPVPDTDHWNYWYRNGTECYCKGDGCNAEKVYTDDMTSLDDLYKSKGAISCHVCVGKKELKTCFNVNEKKTAGYCNPDVKACKIRDAYDRDGKLTVWRECDVKNESAGFLGCRPYTGPVPDTDHFNYWYKNSTDCYCNKDNCNGKLYAENLWKI